MKTVKVKEDCFQQRIFKLIEEMSGKPPNLVIMPEVILSYCNGDKNTALMISQLIYWCDRGSNPDGFIWKSFREWRKETGLSQYQVKRATAKIKKIGFLEVKKAMAMGHPTKYYHLNQEAFEKAIIKFLTMDYKVINNPLSKMQQSITETLAKTSSKTLKSNNGGESKNDSPPISLNTFLKETKEKGEQLEKEAVETIRYFLQQYEVHRQEKHPRLRYEQWKFHMDTIQTFEDWGYDNFNDLTFEDHKKMILKYFTINFDGCDYRLHHYNTDGIKRTRFYEECY